LDNGKNGGGAFLTVAHAVGKAEVHNNTVVNTSAPDPLFVLSADWGKVGDSKDFVFRNNIFASTRPVKGRFELAHLKNTQFKNNLYWNIGEQTTGDKHPVYSDPKIRVPFPFFGLENGALFRTGSALLAEYGASW